MAIDINTLSTNEKGGLIAGIVTFILSLMPAYVSFAGFGVSAWHSYATLGVLLTIVATAIIGAKAFAAENLPDGVPWSLTALATAGLGALLLILRAVTTSPAGPGWSGFLIFVSSIVLAVFTFLMFKESGEKMPKFGEDKAA